MTIKDWESKCSFSSPFHPTEPSIEEQRESFLSSTLKLHGKHLYPTYVYVLQAKPSENSGGDTKKLSMVHMNNPWDILLEIKCACELLGPSIKIQNFIHYV